MSRRAEPLLVLGVWIVTATLGGCGGEAVTDPQQGSNDLVGDWILIRSESPYYTGPVGEGMTYFLVSQSALCAATCSGLPASSLANPCSSGHDCQCDPYHLEGSSLTLAGTTTTVAFEEGNSVLVAETAANGVSIKSWYRRTTSLPSDVATCRAGG